MDDLIRHHIHIYLIYVYLAVGSYCSTNAFNLPNASPHCFAIASNDCDAASIVFGST